MKTHHLIERAGVPEAKRQFVASKLNTPFWQSGGWANRYFDVPPAGAGNWRDHWTERDVVVLRLLIDLMMDGINDPIRSDLIEMLRHCDEGQELISCRQPSGITSYYRPRWKDEPCPTNQNQRNPKVTSIHTASSRK